MLTKHLMREKQIDVDEYVFVPKTCTQERHIHQNVANIEDRDHGD
jgi:hypothetical protein